MYLHVIKVYGLVFVEKGTILLLVDVDSIRVWYYTGITLSSS